MLTVELRMRGGLAEVMSKLRTCLDEHGLVPTDFHLHPEPDDEFMLVSIAFSTHEEARQFEPLCANGEPGPTRVG